MEACKLPVQTLRESSLMKPCLPAPDPIPPLGEAVHVWAVELDDSNFDAALWHSRLSLEEQARVWRAGDLWQLAVGRVQTVIAAPSAIDPARAALLDIFVAAPAISALRIEVDGKRMEAVSLAAEMLPPTRRAFAS